MRTPGTAAFVIRSIVSKRTAERIGVTQIRNFTAAKAPGSDPLELLRKTSEDRNLCDATGFRRPGIHWVFNIAATNGDITQVREILLSVPLSNRTIFSLWRNIISAESIITG